MGGDPTKIALIERGGACAFRTMVQSAEARGYRTLLMFNDNTAGQGCEWLGVIPLQGYTGNTMMLFIPRTIGMRLLGAYNPQTYKCTEGNNANTTPAPAAPMNGKRVTLRALFDGWGYAHLYRTGSGKLTEVDAYAVDEALDEDFATGFGDLSIHEWATDPNANIAYSSYYGAGLRVVRFGDSGIEETGHFVDDGGNNFWGVEQFTTDEQQPRRLIAASDRDFGLYIFRYTGPDAPVLPPKQSPPQNPPLQAPVTPARAEGRDEATDRVALVGEQEPQEASRRQARDPAAARRGLARADHAPGPADPLQRQARQPLAAGPHDGGELRRQPHADRDAETLERDTQEAAA